MTKTTVRPPQSFKDINLEQFRRALNRYAPLIESRSTDKKPRPGQKSLVELDRFRYQEAPILFHPTNGTKQMVHEDVKNLVEWKLRHGKFRPTLMSLVSSNDANHVKTTISEAIQRYCDDGQVQKALTIITRLKGIGPATASLLLSVHDPDNVIFFSDEAFHWLCCNAQKRPIKYNAKEYLDLDSATQSLVQRLSVSATDIEKVAYVVMNQPQPEDDEVDCDDDLKPPADSAKKGEKQESPMPRGSKEQGGGKRKVSDLDDDSSKPLPITTLRRSKRGKQQDG